MFWVYVLENSRGKFYIGQTEDQGKSNIASAGLLSTRPHHYIGPFLATKTITRYTG
jgi:hypothetical protein